MWSLWESYSRKTSLNPAHLGKFTANCRTQRKFSRLLVSNKVLHVELFRKRDIQPAERLTPVKYFLHVNSSPWEGSRSRYCVSFRKENLALPSYESPHLCWRGYVASQKEKNSLIDWWSLEFHCRNRLVIRGSQSVLFEPRVWKNAVSDGGVEYIIVSVWYYPGDACSSSTRKLRTLVSFRDSYLKVLKKKILYCSLWGLKSFWHSEGNMASIVWSWMIRWRQWEGSS